MAELNEHIEVEVPVETAYDAWSNFELFPRYLPYIERITPAGDGVHHHWVVTIGGVRREFDTEVTERVPNQRIAWSSTAGEQQSGEATFQRLTDASSRVDVRLGWKPNGLLEGLAAASGIGDRALRDGLANFKQEVERGSSSEDPNSTEGTDPDFAV
jgi:uncharacterized membrane protein